jgi:O-methyltransferase
VNTIKLLSPDFAVGKALVKGKAILQAIYFIIRNPNRESIRIVNLILQVKPNFTMVRNNNLINLYRSVQIVNQEDLLGDIVECGVWNGGSAAVMGASCKEGVSPKKRSIWLFDSFQGLPPPDERDSDKERKFYFNGWNKGNIDNVEVIFKDFGISLKDVHIVPGWFQSTLKSAPIKNIAILHIDADWYDSVKIVLDELFNKVVPNGFIVLDDYFYWQGCKKAVHDFFSENNINQSIIQEVGKDGAYFRKPSNETQALNNDNN